MDLLTRARRAFYNADGPWYRNRLFELAGSERYARPALFGLDRTLCELMPWRGGTFLEAGAHDGYTQSNTYFLERHRGWKGLLVEPIPELARKCVLRRPRSRVISGALVGPAYREPEVPIHFGDLMSSLEDPGHAALGLQTAGRTGYSVTVPALTLDGVLESAGLSAPDLIALDLEGAELEALAGLDLERHAPRYLLIEALDREALTPRFDDLLAERYERLAAPSDYDLLYRRRQP